MANEHLANNDINSLKAAVDLIEDEYGNYYEVMCTTHTGEKLTKIKLSHIYFETSFSRLFIENDALNEYKHKHIGAFLQDIINSHIEDMKKKNRKIFSIKDLIENEIEVSFLDQTSPHPRSIQK